MRKPMSRGQNPRKRCTDQYDLSNSWERLLLKDLQEEKEKKQWLLSNPFKFEDKDSMLSKK